MSIDWITVSAQVVNFLILVWILKRLLYQPVLEAMEAREQRLADQLRQAVQREQDARDAATKHQAACQQVEQAREQVLSQARTTAEAERKHLLADARAEVAELRERWQKQVDAEHGEFLTRLERQILLAVTSIARRALGDLADETLEARVVAVFQQRLQCLDSNASETLRRANGPVEVVTAFETDPPQRKALTEAVQRVVGNDVPVVFRRDAELIGGIELTAGGQKLGWSLGDYLDDLGEHVEALLSHSTASTAEVSRAP